MISQLEISAVKYLNTQPYIVGLQQLSASKRWQVSMDTPADCALKLRSRRADVGLVPVAALSKLDHHSSITQWGIGADGPVLSVVLLSDRPVTELKAIYLDYQSRTSNELLKILLKEYFQSDPILIDSQPGYEEQIKDDVGGLVIGDRALQLRNQFRYSFDLAEGWKQLTGLPFVFARWVGSAQVSLDDETRLTDAFADGMRHRTSIAAKLQPKYPEIDINQYLHENIHYELGAKFQAGLTLFAAKQVEWSLNSLT